MARARFLLNAICIVGTLVTLALIALRSDRPRTVSGPDARQEALTPQIDANTYARGTGVSSTRYDRSGKRIARVSAQSFSIVAAKLGPFRVAALRDLRAHRLDIELFDRPVGNADHVAMKTAVRLAAGVPNFTRLTAEGFSLQVRDPTGATYCTITSGSARWNALSGRASMLQLGGGVRIDAPLGTLTAAVASIDIDTRRISSRDSYRFVTIKKVVGGVGFEAGCGLEEMTERRGTS